MCMYICLCIYIYTYIYIIYIYIQPFMDVFARLDAHLDHLGSSKRKVNHKKDQNGLLFDGSMGIFSEILSK